MSRALLGLLVVLLLAGCGRDSSTNATTESDTTAVRVYFLEDGKVRPVGREVERTGVFQLEDQLRRGPSEAETKLGLTTEVTSEMNVSRAALAQIVYTLTQFDPTQPVEVGGKAYTRASFEDETPPILVESPLPFDEVSSPLRVTGTANTFEATFQYELLDQDGKVVDKNFVTATSGTGTRGTFDFTTRPFDNVSALRVFELSAENGSRIHEVEIPLSSS